MSAFRSASEGEQKDLRGNPITLSDSSLDYTFIVPAYNEECFLPETIRSIRSCMNQNPYLRGEVLVVNNNSDDRTQEVAEELGCRVVFEPINQIARARNAGARVALGRNLFFLDADTLVPDSTFRAACHALENCGVGAGGATLRFDSNHDRLIAGIILPRMWNFISKTFGYFAGCFIFCRKDLFEKCGGFPETHYAGEEILFSKNIRRQCLRAGLHLKILDRYPVISSSRKLLWYRDWQMLKLLLPTLLLPWVLQQRKFCQFWYKRPQ